MTLPDKEKIIYHKQFPRINPMERCMDKSSLDNTEKEKSLARPIESLWNYMTENSVYNANPKKLAGRQEFIDIAIILSTEYEISMTIKDHLYFVEIIMYWDCCACTGEMKKMLAELVNRCDCINSFIPKGKQCDVILSLDYYTHDHYVSGRKVDYT